MLRRPHLLIFFVALLSCARLARAQPLGDPNFLEFTASPDHAALERYDVLLYVVGTGAPISVVSIGKPTPDGAGTIRLALNTIFWPLPAAGTIYEVRVAAVAAASSSASAPSNSFTFLLPCTYGVAPATRSAGASGGTVTFSVTAPTGCAWTATENASWITIASGAAGIGNGTVTLNVAANGATAARNSQLTIAGHTVSVDQAGAACTFGLSPASRSIGASGGPTTFSVTAPVGCAWTATEGVNWITITGGASGSGNGTVTLSVATNTATSARNTTVTIGGQGATVNQAAARLHVYRLAHWPIGRAQRRQCELHGHVPERL